MQPLEPPPGPAGADFTRRGAAPTGDRPSVRKLGDILDCPIDLCHGHHTATELLLHLVVHDHRRIARIMESVEQLTADAATEAEANQAERTASAKFRQDALDAFARLEQAIIDAGQVTGVPADVQLAMDNLGLQLRSETAAEQQETADLGAADATAVGEEPAPPVATEPPAVGEQPTE